MCCITLDAKVILNNFFGSPVFLSEFREGAVNKEIIDQCSIFISNNLPGYVICDLSDSSIREAVEDGNVRYDFQRKEFIFMHEINREIYNAFYPKLIAKELENIVDCFLQRKLYDSQIIPVKTLLG